MRAHRERGSGSANFVGSGSGIHFVRTVRRAFGSKTNGSRQAAAERSRAADEELVPGEDDRLEAPSPATLWRADELSSPNSENGSEAHCTFEDLVGWSKPYFDFWHPPFPFLHAPTVLGTLEKLSMHGFTRLDQVESAIVRSIMSISVADRRQLPEGPPGVPSHLVFHTTDEAILALQSFIVQPSSLPNLQAVVSIQIFLISMLRLNAASRIGGFIVRMALHLGLHRCPARFEQFSAAEVEIRRRLFWSIYSLERYLSQSLGLPLDLRDDDLDVCYFDNETHQSSDAVPNRSPQGTTATGSSGLASVCSSIINKNIGSHLLLPTFLAKHGRIKGLILELRNKSINHRLSDPDELVYIDAEISRWWNAAQDLVDPIDLEIDPNNQPISAQLNSSQKLLLIVQKHESVILLYRPVITSGYNTSAFEAAMQKCIGASKAIISNVYRHLSSGMESQGDLHGRIKNPLVWPGFVWMVWQSGLILLYAASEGYYPEGVAQRYLNSQNVVRKSLTNCHREASRCVLILENLALRGTFWPSSCAAVIRELQSALSSKTTTIPSPTVRETFSVGNSETPTILASRGESGEGSSNIPTNRKQHEGVVDPSESLSGNELPTASSAFNSPFNQHSINTGYFPAAFTSNDLDVWPDMFSGQGAPGDYRDGSYDIFQLMDPSYLLRGQVTATQLPNPVGNFGNMLFTGQEGDHQQH
jgi:hypothetical protein